MSNADLSNPHREWGLAAWMVHGYSMLKLGDRKQSIRFILLE